MGFYLFAVKFMVNYQTIPKLSDQKIKNNYLNLSKLLRGFAITCIQKLIRITILQHLFTVKFLVRTLESLDFQGLQ